MLIAKQVSSLAVGAFGAIACDQSPVFHGSSTFVSLLVS